MSTLFRGTRPLLGTGRQWLVAVGMCMLGVGLVLMVVVGQNLRASNANYDILMPLAIALLLAGLVIAKSNRRPSG